MPYNPETEQFFQAPATIVDSTPDGDTVQEGFDDRLTPAMAGVYTDLNLLKGAGMIGVGIPATTTARGIGRVATAADMAPGAEVENGPAFLDATGGVITTTPTAHAVPQADANGKLDGWVSPDANKANKDLSNLSTSAGEVIRQNTSLRALGTRETPGTWTLTGVKPGRALIIGARDTSGSTNAYCRFNVLSGSDIGQSPTDGGYFMLGRTNAYISSCSATLKPTSNTVIIRVHSIADMVVYAEQI